MYDRLFLRENTYVPIAHFKWVRVQSQFNNIRSHFNVPIFIEVTSEGLIAVRYFFFLHARSCIKMATGKAIKFKLHSTSE